MGRKFILGSFNSSQLNLWAKSFGATTSFWSLMCETWMNHNHSTVTLFIFMVSTSSTDFLQYYVKMIKYTWHERIIWKFTPEIIIKLYQFSKSFLMLMFVSINKFYEDIVVIEFLHTINMYQGNYTKVWGQIFVYFHLCPIEKKYTKIWPHTLFQVRFYLIELCGLHWVTTRPQKNQSNNLPFWGLQGKI